MIAFFEKNKIDLSLGSRVAIAITDGVADSTGQDFVDLLRNRSNADGWGTTGSNNSANTQIDVDFGDEHEIDSLFLLGQNWKKYTGQYAVGAGSLQDFTEAVDVEDNDDPDKYHSFEPVAADRLQLIVPETFVANDDKFAKQIIVTQKIGEFVSIQPDIVNVEFGRNRRILKAPSGRKKVRRGVGASSLSIVKNNVTNAADLALIERLHDYHNGFLVWLCGGLVEVFPSQRILYRKQDLILMDIASELPSQWHESRWNNGMNIRMDLVETL